MPHSSPSAELCACGLLCVLRDYLSLFSDSTNLKEDIGKRVLKTVLAYVPKWSGTSEPKSVIKLNDQQTNVEAKDSLCVVNR